MNPNYRTRHDVYTIANLIPLYAPHFEKLFYYLDGKVNTYNRCIYYPAMFSPYNFACFKYPNYVIVYCASIIDTYYEGPDSFNKIMSAAAVCIAHELFHADQCIDAATYTKDAVYCTNVENAAEYNAEIFCQAHKADFKKDLGFEYLFGVGSDFGTYEKMNESFIEKFLIGTFRCSDLGAEINKILNENDTVGINITQNGIKRGFLAKYKGEIEVSEDAVAAINKLLSHFKPGVSTYSYSLEIYNGDGKPVPEIGIEEFKVFNIDIIGVTYEPFDLK